MSTYAEFYADFKFSDVGLRIRCWKKLKSKALKGVQKRLTSVCLLQEFRGMSGYRPTACVPALELTRQVRYNSSNILLVFSEKTLFKWEHQGQCCGSGSASKSKARSAWIQDWGAVEAHNAAMEGREYSQWRWGGSKMEPRWVFGKVVTDFHNLMGAGFGSPLKWIFGSGSVSKLKEGSWSRISVFRIPDPAPHRNEKRDLDPHHSLSDQQHWLFIVCLFVYL